MSDLDRLSAILAAIGRLSPAERRQLLKRLRALGLIEPETLLTDARRLEVAPALGRRLPGAGLPPAPATYASPVKGKVVVGPPAEEIPGDPHAMLPLPGQAPEAPVVVVFDGGSKGNPGLGYGSYVVRWPGQPPQRVRLQFGDRVTSNEAEYDTLIAALEALLKRLQEQGADPKTAQVAVWGDSKLVINQVLETWQCKEPRLRTRCDHVRGLLDRFGRWQLLYHPRQQSVELLGH